MKKVLVVGEIMVDRYVYVETTRNAPENGLPVWDELQTDYRLGGAANVANNIQAIGGPNIQVEIAGILGNCKPSRDLLRLMGIKTDLCFGGSTMYKTRYVCEDDQKIFMRSDNMKKFPVDDIDSFKSFMNFCMFGRNYDMVVISDYNKGTVIPEIMEVLKKSAPTIIVDSKRSDLRLFKGSTILKVNEEEYANQVSSKLYDNVESLFECVVVTRGSAGADLRIGDSGFHKKHGQWITSQAISRYSTHIEHFPVKPVEKVVDVTGCGDTHTAGMAVSMVLGLDIRDAVRFANTCARDVVQRFGTSAASFKLKREKDEREIEAIA